MVIRRAGAVEFLVQLLQQLCLRNAVLSLREIAPVQNLVIFNTALSELPPERQHDAAGKLGVPLVFHSFHGIPERGTVCISGRRMGRQHDLGVDKFFHLVVEFRFLVVFTEQPFAALISSPGNSGLPLAALDDGDFEMRTRNRHHLKQKDRPARLLLMNGLESYSVLLAALERSAMLRTQAGAAKG